MKKKIQVIITSDKINKSEQGSISNVTRGYAFNYLIPNQYAQIPSKKRIKHIQMFNKIKNTRKKIQDTKTELFEKRIDQIEKISIYKKTGENYLIFGSAGEKDIIKWVSLNTNLKLQKTKIEIPENKSAGKIRTSLEIKKDKNIGLQTNIIPINI